MGQKVNPHGLRVGVIKDWDSRWYAEKEFADNLIEDNKIRTYLKKKLYSASVSRIEIERTKDRVKAIIFTAKPGIVIGKGGAEIEKLKNEVQKLTSNKLSIDIKEVKKPDADAQLVAENIAAQLENRISFRKAMKSTMSRSMKTGDVKGIIYSGDKITLTVEESNFYYDFEPEEKFQPWGSLTLAYRLHQRVELGLATDINLRHPADYRNVALGVTWQLTKK